MNYLLVSLGYVGFIVTATLIFSIDWGPHIDVLYVISGRRIHHLCGSAEISGFLKGDQKLINRHRSSVILARDARLEFLDPRETSTALTAQELMLLEEYFPAQRRSDRRLRCIVIRDSHSLANGIRIL